MSFPPLWGHDEARRTVGRALEKGRLTQSLLVTGPGGVGKERFGLWLGQLLLCDAPEGSPPAPCGVCRSCVSTERLQHPDLHWFFPLPRPKVSSPEKLGGALEDARAEELAARREEPLYRPEHEKAPAYFVATIRTLQTIASRRPTTGKRAVYVLGDVEKMVPQEGSEAAANAFLKLLEEPPAGVVFVLTTSVPGALLPTVRSRVLPIRLGPLPASDVEGFLEAHGVDADDARRAAASADGSIGAAIRIATRDAPSGPDPLLDSLFDDPSTVYREALDVAPWGSRSEEFTVRLEALLRALRDSGVRSDPRARALWSAARHVEDARGMAQGNVNPQLILASLLRAVREDLSSGEPS